MGTKIKILLLLFLFSCGGHSHAEVLDDSIYFKKKDWVRDLTKMLNKDGSVSLIIGEFSFQENFGYPIYKDLKDYEKDKIDNRRAMVALIEKEFSKKQSGLAFLLKNLPKNVGVKFVSADNIYWNFKKQDMEPFTLCLVISSR
jgi:hypothetical protein